VDKYTLEKPGEWSTYLGGKILLKLFRFGTLFNKILAFQQNFSDF